VIVDSSKAPSYALLLDMIPDLDLHLVHLVRDSRGVAFSWQRADRGEARRRRLRSVRGRLSRSVRAPMGWLSYNTQMPRLAGLGASYVLLRYEDMVRDPQASLQRVLEPVGLGIREEDLALIRDGRIFLEGNHTVYGNRLRFSVGDLALRVDDAWQREMSAASRAWVTAMTFPLLLKYGYPLRGGVGATPLARSTGGP
jgi:sulfotransferase family protein